MTVLVSTGSKASVHRHADDVAPDVPTGSRSVATAVVAVPACSLARSESVPRLAHARSAPPRPARLLFLDLFSSSTRVPRGSSYIELQSIVVVDQYRVILVCVRHVTRLLLGHARFLFVEATSTTTPPTAAQIAATTANTRESMGDEGDEGTDNGHDGDNNSSNDFLDFYPFSRDRLLAPDPRFRTTAPWETGASWRASTQPATSRLPWIGWQKR